MIAANSTQSFSSGRICVAGVRGGLKASAHRVVDNVCAVASITMVAMAALFAVQSWIDPPVVKVILFALLYLVTRVLVRSLFVPQVRTEVNPSALSRPSAALAA
jgi:hypothetical protein